MARKHQLTEEEDAFLEYVQGMRNSVGKRFIMHHIGTYGFESFEAFWEKLKDARFNDPPQVELSKEEAESLANAIHANPRRAFLKSVGGVGLAMLAMNTGMSAAKSLNDAARKGRVMPMEEALGTMLNLTVGAVSGIFSIALLVTEDEPTQTTVAGIAKGEEGEKNVRQLVITLDEMFKPVEIAMQETNMHGY